MWKRSLGAVSTAAVMALFGGCLCGDAKMNDRGQPKGMQPPGLKAVHGSCSLVRDEIQQQVTVREWVAAANAIVLGEVQAVLPNREWAIDRLSADEPRLIPGTDCTDYENCCDVTFVVRLGNVEVLAGEEVGGEIDVHFGSNIGLGMDLEELPSTVGGEIVWPGPGRRIEAGMRLGGAIYRISVEQDGVVWDFWTFRSVGQQPFLFEDDTGRIWFQERDEWACVRYVPPITELGGLPRQEFGDAISHAAIGIDSLAREESRLAYLRQDEPLPASSDALLSVLPTCWPSGFDLYADWDDECRTHPDCEEHSPRLICLKGRCITQEEHDEME